MAGDLESLLVTLEEGIDWKKVADPRSIDEAYDTIESRSALLVTLTLDEKLALTRLAIEKDKYLTALMVKDNTRVPPNTRESNLARIYSYLIQMGFNLKRLKSFSSDADYTRGFSSVAREALRDFVSTFDISRINVEDLQWIGQQVDRLLGMYRKDSMSASNPLDQDPQFNAYYAWMKERVTSQTPYRKP